jgi:hypothetical protein
MMWFADSAIDHMKESPLAGASTTGMEARARRRRARRPESRRPFAEGECGGRAQRELLAGRHARSAGRALDRLVDREREARGGGRA